MGWDGMDINKHFLFLLEWDETEIIMFRGKEKKRKKNKKGAKRGKLAMNGERDGRWGGEPLLDGQTVRLCA